jgi:[acyl-carrier-protein] S-malonyltransferase
MGKLAFIFSGQGAQYVGMGEDICNKYEISERIFEEGSKVLGYDVKNMVFEGNEETLKITEYTQPAILVTSIACLQPILAKGIKPDVAAGLSLGEYSAHVASGTIDFKDAVKLVRVRGKLMQDTVPVGVGAMAAVIGLDNDLVLDLCNQVSTEGIIEPANFNCPGQIVVSGEVEAVEKLVKICKEKGAKRAVILPVSAPFHCSMLTEASKKLAKELEKIKINDMTFPVVSNVTAEYVYDKSIVKDLLKRQVNNPVLWEKSVINMIDQGVDTFIEIGPGKVLSGFIKRTNKKVKTLNVEDLESLNNTLIELGL